MSFDLASIVRPNILALKPYSTARDEFSGSDAPRIMLDANENPYDTGYNRYPDPHQRDLKARIAILKGVLPDQVFLGNGSDEGIDLLVRALCRPGQDSIVIQPPTYGMYEVAAGIQDVAVQRVPLTADFQTDTQAVLAAIQPNTKLIFFCSPNNPTGNRLDREPIVQIASRFPGIVVVDEAYGDFDPAGSFLPGLDQIPNLVVMQTFSKAWGMAGVRLGMLFASKEIIQILSKIKAPYNLSSLAQQAALNGLDYSHVVKGLIDLTRQERARLSQELVTIPAVRKVWPSDANFLLIEVAGGRKAYDYLLANGIVTRDRSSVVKDSIRITVGTADENTRVLEVLRQYQP